MLQGLALRGPSCVTLICLQTGFGLISGQTVVFTCGFCSSSSGSINKSDFDPSLFQMLLLSSMLSHWASQAGGGESSMQLGDRPFFFKEDKEAAENLYVFSYPNLPHVCFV